MGMMTQILCGDKKTAPQKKTEPEKKSACKKCSGLVFWESIYLDGVLRCEACEPPPAEDLVGHRIGQAEPSEDLQPSRSSIDPEDLAGRIREQLERMIECKTADGRWAMALPGWNVPSHANYNQRLCSVAAIGVDSYDHALDELQDEWRQSMGLVET